MLIIPGMTPGMASAIDENLGNHVNSGSGNSTADNGSSYTGDSGTAPDNGSSDSNNTSSDSGSNKVDPGTTPDNGSSDSNNTSSDSGSNKVDSGTAPDNGTSGTASHNKTSGTASHNKTSGTTSHNETSGTGNVSSNSSSKDSSSSDNSSSSSGSGMAPVSSEPASNIAVKEFSTRSVMAGYPVRFDFVKNSTCITYIEFDPKKTFRRTTTVVEELKNTSALVPTPPPGKIYENVNIWVGEGAGLPTSIRDGLVGFRVKKAWIKEKNVSEALVTLQRYDKEWQYLSTEKVGEDENYVYFEAKTPGYSSFAITESTEQNGNTSEIPGEDKIKETLKNLGAGNGLIKDPMRAARIVVAISLPLFMIIAGYCVLKKKI
jgi:clumping factor A